MLRFDSSYKLKRGDNLGAKEFWNQRFQDIDLRLHERELDGQTIDNAVTDMISVALQRLDDTFQPLIDAAEQQLANFGILFEATSSSNVEIGTGEKTFVIAEANRQSFVYAAYVATISQANPANAMIGQVISFARDTGIMVLDVEYAGGSGTHNDWFVTISGPPDSAHASRTDNPHQVTAEQVGAYTEAEVNALLAPKAPLVSPTFAGTPATSAPISGDNTGRIPTCGWVLDEIQEAIVQQGAPEIIDGGTF